MTIDMGVQLAYGLRNEFRAVEAERLSRDLLDISRRTHGSDHRDPPKRRLLLYKLQLQLLAKL
jgi:hypothetical protein